MITSIEYNKYMFQMFFVWMKYFSLVEMYGKIEFNLQRIFILSIYTFVYVYTYV